MDALHELHKAEDAFIRYHEQLEAVKMASRPGSKRPRANAPSAGAEAPAPAPDSGSLGLGSASAAGAGKIVAAPPITAINRVGAPASALGTAVPAPSLGGGGGGVLARMMNAAMTSGTAATGHVMAGTLSKNLQALEDSNDPLLFSQELVSDGWDPSGGKDLVVTVPDGFSSTAGNTMTARCTVRNMPEMKRTYSAVHVLGPGQDISRACLAHVALWQYTDKTQGNDQFYTLGYREGEWHTKRVTYRTTDVVPGPVKFGKPFWLRICLAEGHMLLYLDGRFISAHPLHGNSVPGDSSTIRVMLAVSGDYGERSAMSVEKMWWGWSEPDQRAAAVMAKHAARSAAAAAPSLLAGAAAVSGLGGGAAAVARPSGGVPRNPCKLYIGSWPGDLAPDALKQHFAIFKPVDVMRPPGKSFGFITFSTPEMAARAIQEAPSMPLAGHSLSLQPSHGRH